MKDEQQILVDEVERSTNQVTETKEENNSLEQYTRKNNIRVLGVKDSEKEHPEETEKIIANLFKKHLGIKVNDTDIEIAHRLGRFRKESERSIIVRFTSQKVTNRILSSCRAFKGTGIVCLENLTKMNLDRLRKIKDLEDTEKTWTKRGTTYALNRDSKIFKFHPKYSIVEFSAMLNKNKTNNVLKGHSQPRPHPRRSEPSNTAERSATSVCKSGSEGDLSVIFPARGTGRPRQSTPRPEEQKSTVNENRLPVVNRLMNIANGHRDDPLKP
ncbi:hypothetical protein ElyMa_002017100 [Elysia marginata]|uniref:Uncharacterized protein n=1 Tax=Elysia marginata TaxID=1093978 RepID=A0AAV4F5J5_9GAST|nr:hypothetical protein ElyMa_002017100 [Elysia marginata]